MSRHVLENYCPFGLAFVLFVICIFLILVNLGNNWGRTLLTYTLFLLFLACFKLDFIKLHILKEKKCISLKINANYKDTMTILVRIYIF